MGLLPRGHSWCRVCFSGGRSKERGACDVVRRSLQLFHCENDVSEGIVFVFHMYPNLALDGMYIHEHLQQAQPLMKETRGTTAHLCSCTYLVVGRSAHGLFHDMTEVPECLLAVHVDVVLVNLRATQHTTSLHRRSRNEVNITQDIVHTVVPYETIGLFRKELFVVSKKVSHIGWVAVSTPTSGFIGIHADTTIEVRLIFAW